MDAGQRPPVRQFDLVATTMTIDSVLKGDQPVGVGDSIRYTFGGTESAEP